MQSYLSHGEKVIPSFSSVQPVSCASCSSENMEYYLDLFLISCEDTWGKLKNNTLLLNEAWQESVSNLFPFPVKVVENPLTGKWKKLGVKSELFLLVRPGNYIAFICDALDEVEVRNYLKKHFFCEKESKRCIQERFDSCFLLF